MASLRCCRTAGSSSPSSFASSSTSVVLRPVRPRPSARTYALAACPSLNSPRRLSSSSPLNRRTYAFAPKAYTPKARLARPTQSSSSASASSLLPTRGDISYIPFSHNPFEVRDWLKLRAPTHAVYRSWPMWIRNKLAKHVPRLRIPEVELIKWEAVYVPGWRINAEARIPFRKDGSGDEVDVTVQVKDGFFPGTSELPCSLLSLTPTLLNIKSRPPAYSATAWTQDLEPIRPIPFDLSPLAIPPMIESSSNHLQAAKHTASSSSVEWRSLDANPVYFPCYVAKYRFRQSNFDIYFEATQPNLADCPYNVLDWTAPIPPTRASFRRWLFSLVGSSQSRSEASGKQPALLAHLTAVSSDEKLIEAVEGKRKWITGTGKWHVGMGAKGVVNVALERWLDRAEERERLRRVSTGEERVGDGGVGGVGRVVRW